MIGEVYEACSCDNSMQRTYSNSRDYQKQQVEMMQRLAEMESQAEKSMRRKLERIAELFELDVLSEEDALKACKTVIQQHAKKVGRPERS